VSLVVHDRVGDVSPVTRLGVDRCFAPGCQGPSLGSYLVEEQALESDTERERSGLAGGQAHDHEAIRMGDERLPLVPHIAHSILDPGRGAFQVQGAGVVLGLSPVAHVHEQGPQRSVGLGEAPLQLPDEAVRALPIARSQCRTHGGQVFEGPRVHARIHRPARPQCRVVQVDLLRAHAAEYRGAYPAVSDEQGLLEVLRRLLVAKFVAGRVGVHRRSEKESGG
jgi:hypothetical protein